MSSDELAQREQRAQGGILQFAEEMEAIRDRRLYPGAQQENGAWADYCKDRWSLGVTRVDEIIRARPVLTRRGQVRDSRISIKKAATVATLAIPVQDFILTDDPKSAPEADVKAQAKAARKTIKAAEREGREATVEEQIEAARLAPTKPKKSKKRKMPPSKFIGELAAAHWHLEQAANIAHAETLDDVDNDYGWSVAEKLDYQMSRLRERLYRPEIVKNVDEEFAGLLNGDER